MTLGGLAVAADDEGDAMTRDETTRNDTTRDDANRDDANRDDATRDDATRAGTTPWRRRLGVVSVLALTAGALTVPTAAPEASANSEPLAVSSSSVGDATPGRAGATAYPARLPAQSRNGLARSISAALGSARSDVSVSVRDRRTGTVFSYNPSLVNCTGSIVKVMVLVATLRKQRSLGRGLTATQQTLASRMIRYSDNASTTTLFRYVGGAPTMTALARRLGMTRTTGARAWGRTTTTARDQRVLIQALVGGTSALRAGDRAYVLRLMGAVTAGQRWGVGTVPSGVTVRLKNGWVPLSPRAWRVNSIGHVRGKGRDYEIAILSYDNSSMGVGVRRVNKVADLVYDSLASAWSS